MEKRLTSHIKIVILLVAATGFVTIASVAPNVLRIIPFLRKILKKKTEVRKVSYKLKKISEYLIKEGYINKSGEKLFLTNKGELLLMKIKPELIKRPKWDHKWRIVSFDVRENNRKKRDSFRKELKALGFVQMQRSVWISPYPCEKYIELLRAEHGFGNNMQYILAEKISEENKFIKYFKI